MHKRVKTQIIRPVLKGNNQVSQIRNPGSTSSLLERIMFLQRTAGNQVVEKMLRPGAYPGVINYRRKPVTLMRGGCPFLCDEKSPVKRDEQEDEQFRNNMEEKHLNRYHEGEEKEATDDKLYHDSQGKDKLYQGSGSTWCSTASGTPQISVTEHCAGNCVRQHENVHANDIRACCASYKNCIDTGGSNCASRWRAWVNSIRDWTECRAYRREVSCLTSFINSNCGSGGSTSSACCTTLRSELSTARTRRGNHCPGTTHACPF